MFPISNAALGRRFSLFVLIASMNGLPTARADTLRVPGQFETLQSAIDAAKDGDTILVGPGTYHERIRLKEGVILKSDGDDSKGRIGLKRAEAAIIDGSGENAKDEKSAGVTMAENSTLDGFTVTAIGEYDDAVWQKHHATNGNGQSHEHIGAPGTPGIRANVNCKVSNNIVHHIGYTGIAISGSPKAKGCSPHIFRNICYRNMGGGIGSMRQSTAMIQENVCYQNFYAGIGHDDASPTVLNNICYENIRAGIGISEGSCPIVRGNKCYKNRRAGIGIRTGKATRPIIEDNDCYENGMAGIGSEDHASPTICNNRCSKNKLAGIGSRTHASPTIIGNECFQNETVGIGQESDSVTTLIGNHCHHNKLAGIGFEKCQSGRSTVIRNRVIDNAKVAIGIHEGWTVNVSNNQLSRTGGMPPLVMVFAGAHATFTDNIIKGDGVAGIRVAGIARVINNEFVGNSLRKGGPPNFAIWALAGADVSMTGNRIKRWRRALHANEATVFVSDNTVQEFHGTALVIQNSPTPSSVFGNTAVSTNPEDKALTIGGETGIISSNRLVETTEEEHEKETADH